MHDLSPPTLETFSHWPSWLNARGNLDRSACFELKVSEVRRVAGCVPMKTGPTGKVYRAKGRAGFGVADLPNERASVESGASRGRLSRGWFDVDAFTLDWLARGHYPRRLGGDWRTGRAPAMRNEAGEAMGLGQGGYGVGSYGYELQMACPAVGDPAAGGERVLDAGLKGNPNRGATRSKFFSLDDAWRQRLWLEKWERVGAGPRTPPQFRVQYFLLCPGPGGVGGLVRGCADQVGVEGQEGSHGIGCADAMGLGGDELGGDGLTRSTVGARGLKGLTGTTSNAGDGSGGAHGVGWACGQRVYKLFWVLAREGEVRDALLAERWIAGLDSAGLAARSSEVSGLVERYGAIMGVRALRCRRCLRLRYGQSPEVLRRKRRRSAWAE